MRELRSPASHVIAALGEQVLDAIKSRAQATARRLAEPQGELEKYSGDRAGSERCHYAGSYPPVLFLPSRLWVLTGRRCDLVKCAGESMEAQTRPG